MWIGCVLIYYHITTMQIMLLEFFLYHENPWFCAQNYNSTKRIPLFMPINKRGKVSSFSPTRSLAVFIISKDDRVRSSAWSLTTSTYVTEPKPLMRGRWALTSYAMSLNPNHLRVWDSTRQSVVDEHVIASVETDSRTPDPQPSSRWNLSRIIFAIKWIIFCVPSPSTEAFFKGCLLWYILAFTKQGISFTEFIKLNYII